MNIPFGFDGCSRNANQGLYEVNTVLSFDKEDFAITIAHNDKKISIDYAVCNKEEEFGEYVSLLFVSEKKIQTIIDLFENTVKFLKSRKAFIAKNSKEQVSDTLEASESEILEEQEESLDSESESEEKPKKTKKSTKSKNSKSKTKTGKKTKKSVKSKSEKKNLKDTIHSSIKHYRENNSSIPLQNIYYNVQSGRVVNNVNAVGMKRLYYTLRGDTKVIRICGPRHDNSKGERDVNKIKPCKEIIAALKELGHTNAQFDRPKNASKSKSKSK